MPITGEKGDGVAGYLAEEDLVQDLITGLHGLFDQAGAFAIGREFYFQRGRTDVVVLAASERIIAFEAKLLKWRAALQQAYRNTCYAHRSYIALPVAVAQRASRFTYEFHRRAVGLCSVEASEVRVLIEARYVEPIEPWLTDDARTVIRSGMADAA